MVQELKDINHKGHEGTQRNSSHQNFVGAAHNRVLHFLQIVLDLVESVNALLEVTREVGEKRSYLRVLEMLELGDDVIALLAGFYPVHEILCAVAAQPEVINALRKHAGKEECVISNVLAHLEFSIEGGCRAIHRIGFDQHLADIG